MPRWLPHALGLLILQILSCSPGHIRRTPDLLGNRLPTAIIVEREIKGEIFNVKLKQPSGLAVDASHNLYLCDKGNHRILKFDSALIPTHESGGYGSDDGLFKNPIAITVDSDNRVFVTDAINRRVQQLDTLLAHRSQMRLEDPDEPMKFGSPSGIAVTGYGELRIADNERSDLIFLNSTGVFEKIVGDLGFRGGQLQDPQGVAVDREDNVFVCDAGNGRVVRYDKYGEFEREIFVEGLQRPVSALIDATDRIWILDQSSALLFLCSPDGVSLIPQPLMILGATSPLDKPHAMVFLDNRQLIISDQGNDRLLVCRVLIGAEK